MLAVLGTGVWFGVQHLGYLEFGELRRVAQRTMEQRQIFINNLAIRRAIEALKVSSNYEELCGILEAAFGTNDFDAFELRLHRLPGELHETHGLQLMSAAEPYFRWKRPGSHFSHERVNAWSLTLDLMTTTNQCAGYMTVYRLYTQRDLQLDVNLLTSAFPIALADALDRALTQVVITRKDKRAQNRAQELPLLWQLRSFSLPIQDVVGNSTSRVSAAIDEMPRLYAASLPATFAAGCETPRKGGSSKKPVQVGLEKEKTEDRSA